MRGLRKQMYETLLVELKLFFKGMLCRTLKSIEKFKRNWPFWASHCIYIESKRTYKYKGLLSYTLIHLLIYISIYYLFFIYLLYIYSWYIHNIHTKHTYHVCIHTYHTYLIPCIRTYIHTHHAYMQSCIHTYHVCIHTIIHTIHT